MNTPIDYVANGENDEYDPQYDLVDREENTKAMLMYFGYAAACLAVLAFAIKFLVTR